MSTAIFILQILITIFSLLIILLVLLHKGRGGGISDVFGGGVTMNIASSGMAEKNLNRITIWMTLIWFVFIVIMGILIKIQTPGVGI